VDAAGDDVRILHQLIARLDELNRALITVPGSRSTRKPTKTLTSARFFQHDYPTLDDLRRGVPRLILADNLHGIDIDLRATDLPPREIACPNG
jgi:hypothetical protein